MASLSQGNMLKKEAHIEDRSSQRRQKEVREADEKSIDDISTAPSLTWFG
jgi:hypothetical protein